MAGRKMVTRGSAMPTGESVIPRDYEDWLVSLKSRIAGARQRATLAVNQELVRLYHHIGTEILERQTRQGWGAKVIDRLAADLRAAFPEMKGFSSRNLKYMKYFAQMCPAGLIGQQPAAQLPWFHLVTLLTKVAVTASASGMRRKSSSTAGRGPRWMRTSRTSSTGARAPPSPTSTGNSPRRMPNSPARP